MLCAGTSSPTSRPGRASATASRRSRTRIPEFLLRLWNVYSFFVIYANIDGFDPAKLLAGDVGAAFARRAGHRQQTIDPLRKRSELDRWIASELNRTAAMVTARMDAYDNYAACQADHGVCRCPVELVRSPQPRPLLGDRARSPTSWTPTGRCTSA